MLSIALYVAGGLPLVAAAVTLLLSGTIAWFVPQLVVGGMVLIVGLAIERWRYKPIRQARPQPGWADTGERFVDPGTGQLIAVYFDAAKGERHYLALLDSTSRT